MQLVQILLPLYDSRGRVLERKLFDRVRSHLAERFSGVTTFTRAPARGLWKDEDGSVVRDDIVIYEVMVDRVEREWWKSYREALQRAFGQDEIVIRAIPVERL